MTASADIYLGRFAVGGTYRLPWAARKGGKPWDLTAGSVALTFVPPDGSPPFTRPAVADDPAGGLFHYDTVPADLRVPGSWGLEVTVTDGAVVEPYPYPVRLFVFPDRQGLITAAASGGVTSFNTRTGDVVLATADVTGALTYTPVAPSRSVLAGTGLSGGGTLAADVSLSMPDVGTPGTYGDATHYPVITTDAQGRVTAASLQGVAPGGVTSFDGRTGAVVLAAADLPVLSDVAPGAAPASGGGTANFLRADGAWAPPASAAQAPPDSFVLRFIGPPQATQVDHGLFWGHAAGTDLGAGFWWEAWLKLIPGTAGYLISDGYGGGHALLWGLLPAANGNIWNGTAAISFNGSYGPAVGEWVHAAVFWVSGQVYTAVNGVLDGQTAFAGPRVAPGVPAGAGHLYVGGSDHSNGSFDLAAIRGWDRQTPLNAGGLLTAAFTPARWFFGDGYDGSAYTLAPDFMADYTAVTPGLVADHAPEGVASLVGGVKRKHPGSRNNPINIGSARLLAAPYVRYPSSTQPFPFWVPDATCPYGRPVGSPLPAEAPHTPAAVPGGALVFDSFARPNQTFAFQNAPTLGSTEGGSRGPLAWQYTGAAVPSGIWGILGGQAVFLGSSTNQPAWVNVGVSDMDVRVTNNRFPGGGQTGLCFRVQDATNYWFGYSSGSTLYHGKLVAGVYTLTGSVAIGSTWTTLRAVASGTTITFYADATQVAQLTGQTDMQTATGAGLVNAPTTVALANALARYKNFTVFAG